MSTTLLKSRCQKVHIKRLVDKVPYKKGALRPSKKSPAKKYRIDMLAKKGAYKRIHQNTAKNRIRKKTVS